MEHVRQRKRIRLEKEVYVIKEQPFSITICTHDKRPILKEFRELIFRSITEDDLSHKSDLMAACVMPDHVHLLLAPIAENLMGLIGRWKSYTTRLMWGKGFKGLVWERSFYDHALRKDEDLIKVADYIVFNPVRRGLVQGWKDYPYSWHKWM
jgi:putative transposase